MLTKLTHAQFLEILDEQFVGLYFLILLLLVLYFPNYLVSIVTSSILETEVP